MAALWETDIVYNWQRKNDDIAELGTARRNSEFSGTYFVIDAHGD